MEAMKMQPPAPDEGPAGEPVLADDVLLPGVVVLPRAAGGGAAAGADRRALALLGCRDSTELAAAWPSILESLEAGGLPMGEPAAIRWQEVELKTAAGGERRLRVARLAGGSEGGMLLLQDADLGAALESDLRAASQMRSLAEITPAMAHDLRAPINAMVLNLEVLRQSLAAAAPMASFPTGERAQAAPPMPSRERQQRYVHVLGEELMRLHKELEIFLAHISPRGDRRETIDLREAAQELATLLRPPARKLLARVEVVAPDVAAPVTVQRNQLRQALLHTGLAALNELPREGMLEIRVERASAHARLRIAATAPGGGQGPMPSPGPRLGAGPSFSAAGTEARLEVAASLLAGNGGALREARGASLAAAPDWPAAGGGERHERAAPSRAVRAFEIDLPLSEPH